MTAGGKKGGKIIGGGVTRAVTSTPSRFRAHYGASPLHLLALLASFAIAAAAVIGWFQRPRDLSSVLVWFAAAIIVHDLVLLPLYSLLDRIGVRLHRRLAQARDPTHHGPINPTPFLRIPAILSGLLLVVFFPVIFGLGARTELGASGIAEHGYLARWLATTGVMFALSGAIYVVAVARASAPATTISTSEPAAKTDANDRSAQPPGRN